MAREVSGDHLWLTAGRRAAGSPGLGCSCPSDLGGGQSPGPCLGDILAAPGTVPGPEQPAGKGLWCLWEASGRIHTSWSWSQDAPLSLVLLLRDPLWSQSHPAPSLQLRHSQGLGGIWENPHGSAMSGAPAACSFPEAGSLGRSALCLQNKRKSS